MYHLIAVPRGRALASLDCDGDGISIDERTTSNGSLNPNFQPLSQGCADPNSGTQLSSSSPNALKRKMEPHMEPHMETDSQATHARPARATTIISSVTRARSRASLEFSAPKSSVSSDHFPRKKQCYSATLPPKQDLLHVRANPSPPQSLLRDAICPNLILVFVGVNPGLRTGSTGFAYAHPSNLFWKLLHSSGITAIQHPPSDTYRLPELYNVGNTNIIERPTRNVSVLSKAEMDAGVRILEQKIASQRPEAVCLVGKSIWEAVWRVKKGRPLKKEEFRYGWQNECDNIGNVQGQEEWKGSLVFVSTTTSGLAFGMSLAAKQAIWSELGRWVLKRRENRKAAAT